MEIFSNELSRFKRAQEDLIRTLTAELQNVYRLSSLPELQALYQKYKEWSFYQEKKEKKHERLIQSQATGELMHIDCNYALFVPLSKKNYFLTTITDDYSRFILDAKLTETENTQEHIKSLRSIFETYGLPKNYHINGCFSNIEQENINTLLKDSGVSKLTGLDRYSCFSADKSYSLLQENLTRACIEKNITEISETQKILNDLVKNITTTQSTQSHKNRRI